jgi:peroxiredoxin
MWRMIHRALLILALTSAGFTGVAAADTWRAPAFQLRELDGTPHALASYRGKVVVLEFFASWCPSCRASVRSLNALARRYPGKLEVVAVSTDEDDPHGLPEFVEAYQPNYTVLVDASDLVGRQYRVMGFPTYYVIDAKGMVRATHDGSIAWDDPRNQKKLESLFEEPPAAAPEAAPMPVTTVSLGPDRR